MAQIEINEATIKQAIKEIGYLKHGIKSKYNCFDLSFSLGEKEADNTFKDDISLNELTDDDWAGLFRGDYYLFWDVYDYNIGKFIAWGNILYDTCINLWSVTDNDFRK